MSINYPAQHYICNTNTLVSPRRHIIRSEESRAEDRAVIWSGEVGEYSGRGINEKKLQSMSFQLLPPKDVIIKSSGMKDSETSIRYEFVTLSLRREGVIDCCDLSLFQLSLLGKEGGGNLKYA